MPTVKDGCGVVKLEYKDGDLVVDCGTTGYIIRTWTATDENKQTATCDQKIIVYDDTPPTVTAPADITIACTDDVANLHLTGQATATDNCTADKSLVVKYADAVVAGVEGSGCYTIARTFTTKDDCGNLSLPVTQTITVEDDEKPVVTAPADITIACTDPLPAPTGATATDNCSSVTENPPVDMVVSGDRHKGCYVIRRTFSFTDACHNTGTAVQIITVEDKIRPVVTAPADITIACTDDVDDLHLTGKATASDNCTADKSLVVKYADAVVAGVEGSGCYTIARTFTTKDDCGNLSLPITQTITVEDDEKPVVTAPADVTIACTDDVDDLHLTGQATATDNCTADKSLVVKYADAVVAGVEGSGCYTIARTFTTKDDCGNLSLPVTQTITVEDDEKPVVTAPADVTIACTDPLPAPTGATATDNCSSVTENPPVDIVVSGNRHKGCYVIERTFSFTDACHNTGTAVQTITVEDSEKPNFNDCPMDETVDCTDEIPALYHPMAEDNCDTDVEVVYNGEVKDASCGPGFYTLTRSWTATDNCGNSALCEQVITVRTRLTDPCYSLQLNRDYDEASNTTRFVWELCLIGEDCKSLSNIRFSIPCSLPKSALLDTYSSVDGVKPEISGNQKRCDRGYFVVFESFGEDALKFEPDQCATFSYTIEGDLRDYEVDVPIKAGNQTGLGFEDIGETCDCDGSTGFGIQQQTALTKSNQQIRYAAGIDKLELFPNPATEAFTLGFQSPEDQEVLLQIFNASGQLQTARTLSVTSGNNQMTIGSGNLPSGLYRILLTPDRGQPLTTHFVRVNH